MSKRRGPTHDTIESLIADAIRGRSGNQLFVEYRRVSDLESARIKQETGLDVRGYVHSLDEAAIRHILNRHSSDPLPVTTSDLRMIPFLTKEYDRLQHTRARGSDAQEHDALTYSKRVDGLIYFVAVVRRRRKKLAALTMWKVAVKSTKE